MPVVLNGDAGEQRGMVSTFFRRVAAHFANQMAVVTPNGVLLSHDLDEGLRRWQALDPAARRTLDDLGPFDASHLPPPPPGGLILRVFSRGLIRGDDGALGIYKTDVARSFEPGRDHLWLTAAEARSLVPDPPDIGARVAVSEAIVDRIARRGLLDLVRVGGNGGPRRSDEVREADLRATVESTSAAEVRLRLEGAARVATHDAGSGAQPDRAKVDAYELLGHATWDRANGRFTGFDLLAYSETGHYDEIHGKIVPLGISFELLAGGTPAERVPPSSFGPDYFIADPRPRGEASVEVPRPATFPHRIWAACDFEVRTPDYAWFGPAVRDKIPAYPGNATALGVGERPYRDFSALMTGINPVPGPRMGKINQLYLRYLLTGATEATFQHFSLSSEDNNHLRLSGLTEGKWSEATMNFTHHARRNDGTPGVPFQEGERMDDLKIFVGKPDDGNRHDLFIDDVIFFANDPDLPPEPEPFPRRVFFLAGFDTGATPEEQPKYWPGEFELAQRNLPAGTLWNAARAVPQKEGRGKWIRLQLDPVRTVGARTKLRFRAHLIGTRRLTVQIFDLTDQDNRHIHLANLEPGAWQTHYLDFTRDARRNDGGDTPFAAGHQVDDLFFFVQPDGDQPVELLIDEVILFDAHEAPAPGPALNFPAPP